MAEAARTYGLTVAEVEDWREKFLLGAENALRTRPKDEDAVELAKGSDPVPSNPAHASDTTSTSRL